MRMDAGGVQVRARSSAGRATGRPISEAISAGLGSGVLLVSEDLDDLIGIADRIVVLSGGRLVGDVAAADATREALGVLMTGGPREHAA